MLRSHYIVKILALFTFFTASFYATSFVTARPDITKKKSGRLQLRTAEACQPATSNVNLDVNNVRALLQNGGDMWWDLVSNPQYEVPKVDDPANAKHSLFAGSLWIGGVDASGQLRVAAQTYRQNGNDFFPGPLTNDGSATAEKAICAKWDKHFKITKDEINKFRANFETGGSGGSGDFPAIYSWPAAGSDLVNALPAGSYARDMAPFIDNNNDGVYNPKDGDYPDIVGDQAVWWVQNDKGDIHTETFGEQIGVEIQMMAFAFSTTNAVNNMTFYKQKVINRSGNILQNTYIGQWVDSDLGYPTDDYVGCDTTRGLGFCFNGDAVDDLPQGYGPFPPAVGVDFFQGPQGDEVDADGKPIRLGMKKFIYYNNDFSVRGNPEQATHYYGYLTGQWKNGAKVSDDREGNGNGYPDQGETPVTTNYMFPDYPGTSQCAGISYSPTGKAWNEASAGNPPQDRRFIQSAGPFTLLPGAVNEIVTGVVWARDQNGALDKEQFGSVCALLAADDVAQALFDANFAILDGPDAPDLVAEELDRELILKWDYSKRSAATSNNYFENYAQRDPTLIAFTDTIYKAGKDTLGFDASGNPITIDIKVPDKIIDDYTYQFEGYLVYQLLNDQVSATELTDANKARLIAQCDVKNDVKTVVNRTNVGGIITDKVMVDGANKGIFHTFKVTSDAFAEGADARLVNYRPFYFAVVSYAYNDLRKNPSRFIQGRGNFRRLQAIPHKVQFEKTGLVLSSAYGDSPEIMQVSGSGSGGNFLRLTPETEEKFLQAPYFAEKPVYASGFAPINVKITNPKAVQNKRYRVEIVRNQVVDTLDKHNRKKDGSLDTSFIALPIDSIVQADWVLKDVTNNANDVIFRSKFVYNPVNNTGAPKALSGTEFNVLEEGAGELADHGFSVSVLDVDNPGNYKADLDNGFLGAELTFADPDKAWLGTGMLDIDISNKFTAYNWIRSGDCFLTGDALKDKDTKGCAKDNGKDYWDRGTGIQATSFLVDPNEAYEKVLGRTWAPYTFTAYYNSYVDIIGPGLKIQTDANLIKEDEMAINDVVTLDKLPNIDVILTTDPNKWSRCVVVETSPSKALGAGGHLLAAKWRKSIDKNACLAGNAKMEEPASENEEYGLSWFPGYAVNVDNGERLNIFFGEATWYKAENGDDMLFNPTKNLGRDEIPVAIGGRHYLYVSKTRYDECKQIAQALRIKRSLVFKTGAEPSGFKFHENKDDTIVVARLDDAYKNVAWTSIPLLSLASRPIKGYADIPTDARFSIRVDRKFADNSAYEFDMGRFAAAPNVKPTAEAAVKDLINIVPNPYYGRSGVGRGRYEKSQLDARAKITNLPQKCQIRIYTLGGALVRTFNKENDLPSQDWDLKNDFGVPIASGLYVIYISTEGLGEKILKFYAIMPDIDLNAY